MRSDEVKLCLSSSVKTEDFAKEVDYLGGSRAGGQGCLTGKTIVFPVGNSMISSV